MPTKFNELLLRPDIEELYQNGVTPDYGYLLNGRFEKDMIKTLYPLKTLSGNPITWEASNTEYLFPVISLAPKQAGSGDPSPENVRPISGRDSVQVTKCGKNLLEISLPRSFSPDISTRFSLDLDLTGTFAFSAQIDFTEPGTTTSALFSFVVDGTEQYISAGSIKDGKIISGHLSKLSLINWSNSAGTISEIQLELGSTLTAYEPYQGSTTTLNLPETIYGGTVDAVTGVGSKEWEYVEFDGTEDWHKYPIANASVFYLTVGSKPITSPIDITFLSNILKWKAYNWGSPNPWTISGSPLNEIAYINAPEEVASTVEEWKSYLAAQYSAGTPVTVCYKLATPEPFQATGNQSLTIQPGNHTIYTDGDTITLKRKVRRLNV